MVHPFRNKPLARMHDEILTGASSGSP